MEYRKGFTLIELLVVIALIGILSAILFASINPKDRIDDAKDKKTIVAVDGLRIVAGNYFLNHDNYTGLRDDGTRAKEILDKYPEITMVNTDNK